MGTSFSKAVRRAGDRRGFTLIEILVVLGLIVVLVGLLVPAIGRMKKNAVKAAAAAQMHALQTGLRGYYNDMGSMFPPSDATNFGYGGTIQPGRGSVMLAQGLMGFLPANMDGAGPPNESYGFRLRSATLATMKGTGGVSGPYASTDPKGYKVITPQAEEVFIDPWEHEILYFRSVKSNVSNTGKIFANLSVSPAECFFNAADCTKTSDGQTFDASTLANPATFFPLISSGTTDNYTGGIVLGSDSYLLISAGPDGIYFTADDIVAGKE